MIQYNIFVNHYRLDSYKLLAVARKEDRMVGVILGKWPENYRAEVLLNKKYEPLKKQRRNQYTTPKPKANK